MKEDFDIISEVEKLNVRIYQLYMKLDRYKDKLSEAAYRYLSDKLFLVYREEFEKMYEDYGIERDQARYKAKKKRANMIPRERFFALRKNRAAKKFIAEVNKTTEKFFAEVNDRGEQAAPLSRVDNRSEKSKSNETEQEEKK